MSEIYANNARATLAQDIGTSDTSVAVETGHTLPALAVGDWFRLTLFQWEFYEGGVREFGHEVVKVTSSGSDTLTIERAIEGAALSHASGTSAELRPTAGTVDAVRADAKAYTDTHSSRTDNPHAVTAAQVGADPEGSADAAETAAKSYTDTHEAKTETHGAPAGERIAHTGDLGSAAAQDDTRYAHRTNNLSDLDSAATARNNLGGNAAGARTVSTAEPSGGSDGDIWYGVD